MVAWIWGWMEGLKLELDESFGGAISSKFATSRKLLLLHQNTLVASARYLYYRMWYLKYLMLQGVVLFFFFICLYSKWKQRMFLMNPILRDEYASSSRPFAIISSN
jgi:hypothetical protein